MMEDAHNRMREERRVSFSAEEFGRREQSGAIVVQKSRETREPQHPKEHRMDAFSCHAPGEEWLCQVRIQLMTGACKRGGNAMEGAGEGKKERREQDK
ncbi:hypothetical protein NDU88_002049 [Pleurodeles waltl]|uniref:Uncharacterized protein n=1 Tax=Pleurodeles waltl TaxID=8319 RepID=A0AAV7MN91_PLEWA|nr:hypothetical protein NDU88_002049 [Pleurodeles waltl]